MNSEVKIVAGKNLIRKFVSLAAGILLAAVVWLLVASRDSTPMPVYKGLTVKQWFYDVPKTSSSGSWEAFEQMGSNAVPFLLHELSRRNSVGELFSGWLYPKLPSVISSHLRMPLEQSTRWYDAAAGLKYINSHSAIPALTNLLADGDPEQQCLVLYALEGLLAPNDTNCIPAVTNCLRSTNVYVCIEAARALQRLNAGKLAVPALTNFVTSTNWQERLHCLDSLSHIDSANANKWQQMLTNDPDSKAEQRVPRGR